MQCILKPRIKEQIFNHFIIREVKKLFKDRGSDYNINRSVGTGSLIGIKTEKRSSSIIGKTSSANVFAPGPLKGFLFTKSEAVKAIKHADLL